MCIRYFTVTVTELWFVLYYPYRHPLRTCRATRFAMQHARAALPGSTRAFVSGPAAVSRRTVKIVRAMASSPQGDQVREDKNVRSRSRGIHRRRACLSRYNNGTNQSSVCELPYCRGLAPSSMLAMQEGTAAPAADGLCSISQPSTLRSTSSH